MKKILFFSKNLNIGGMEKALVSLLNSLISDYQITLLLEEKKGILIKELNEKIKIEEYKLNTNKNPIIRKSNNLFKRTMWKIKNFKKYDFACNYATYSIIGTRICQAASKNKALYIHSDYYNVYKQNKEEVQNFFEPHKLSKYNHLIFVSNESMNNFLKIYPKYKNKVTVINNLIDTTVLDKSLEKITVKINKKNKNFIFIGRLDNGSKNFDLMLEAFNIAISKDKNIKLYIVGSGPYKAKIQSFIQNHNIISNIILINETVNPYPYLKACDCLILTSNYEGFPVIYLEALVLNKKIMTTIITSDESININNYCIKLKREKADIAKKILDLKRELIDYNLDFTEINKRKITKIINIIEEE